MNTNSPDTRLSLEAAFSRAIEVGKARTFNGEFLTLWTKGWLETRALVFLLLVFFALNVATEFLRVAAHTTNPAASLSDFLVLWLFVPPLLAANGIRTRTRFRASADAHQSMYYTLSLPVSRFRLLAVRAAVGFVEVAAIVIVVVGAIWIFLPSFRANATLQDALLYTLTLLAYCSAFYFLSVLLSAWLEGPWRTWATVLFIAGLRWVGMHLPQFPFDILAPIAADTPLVTHAFPWQAICVSIGFAAVCFVAALKGVDAREF